MNLRDAIIGGLILVIAVHFVTRHPEDAAPPLMVGCKWPSDSMDDAARLRVASGFHRTNAALQAQEPELRAEIRVGGIREARSRWHCSKRGTNDPDRWNPSFAERLRRQP